MQYFEHEEDLYALDSDSLSARVGDLVLVRRLEKPHQKNVQHKVESIVQRLGDFRDYQVRKKEVQKYPALLVFFVYSGSAHSTFLVKQIYLSSPNCILLFCISEHSLSQIFGS